MKKISYKIGLLLLTFTLFCGFNTPHSLAQESLFDTLDDIKEKVQEDQNRIGEGGVKETVSVQLIDYSRDSKWGGLSGDLVKALKDDNYKSINDVKGRIKDSLIDTLQKSNDTSLLQQQDESLADYDKRIASYADSILYAYRVKSWGNLDPKVITILDALSGTMPNVTPSKTVEVDNLGDLAKVAGYSQSKGNANDLITYLQTNVTGLSTDDINSILYEVRFSGESQMQSIVLAVTRVMRNLIGALAILWIIISGLQLIFAHGDESAITQQKRAITYSIIGLAVILLLDKGITIIYGIPGAERGLATTGEGISTEVLGLISFAKAVIGAAAIFMIMISGFKIITAQGEEEKLTQQKKSILWIIIGIVIILINQVIVQNLYIDPVKNQLGGKEEVITQSNVINIINTLGTITQFVLGFVGIIAFGALIYGAGSMIASYGNDEAVEKGKKIIKNAIIGIIVILSAFAIVSTLIKFG